MNPLLRPTPVAYRSPPPRSTTHTPPHPSLSPPHPSQPPPHPSQPPPHPSRPPPHPPQPPPQPPQPPPHQQQHAYSKHYSQDAQYEQDPSFSYPNVQRAAHLHMPGVNTYIEHYHYYNFNGNCTVQQASGDGQTNAIHMAPPSGRQPRYSSHNLEVPPVPPAMSNPLQPQSDSYQPYPHNNPDPFSRGSTPHHASLPDTHLAPLSIARPISTTAPQVPPHSSLLATPRLAKALPTIPDTRQIQPQPPLLPRLRTAEPEPSILAPLQPAIPSSLSPLHADDKLSNRPTKRSRLSSRNAVNMPLGVQSVTAPLPASATPAGGSDSNCRSTADDRAVARPRGPTYPVIDRPINTTNSSSPSQSEYPLAARTEGFERSSTGTGSARATRNADESQSNDWEAVVEMYTTGKGTEDGVALKMITKGDGRRVSDRKLLEKRRTIGKTYECLGVERFERAIGYKWDNGVRRKQKMYHVISRCRVVNAMRKAGESIPTDCEELTQLINGRIAEKEALKAGIARRNSAGNSGAGGGRIGVSGVGGALLSGMGYSLEEVGRIRDVGPHGRESRGSGTVVDVGNLHGGRNENDGDGGGRGRVGHGRSNATNGSDEGGLGGRDEDEIRPGRANEVARYV